MLVRCRECIWWEKKKDLCWQFAIDEKTDRPYVVGICHDVLQAFDAATPARFAPYLTPSTWYCPRAVKKVDEIDD